MIAAQLNYSNLDRSVLVCYRIVLLHTNLLDLHSFIHQWMVITYYRQHSQQHHRVEGFGGSEVVQESADWSATGRVDSIGSIDSSAC